MKPAIPYLEHALLDVSDLSRSLPFYRALLPDWTVRWSGTTENGDRWVHFGPPGDDQPGYLSLYETPGASRPDRASGELAIEHVGFAHPDVDALVEGLEKAGILPHDRVADGSYKRVYFADPDGHQLEFVQEL